MIPGQFDYVRPGNLDEALRILKDREGEAKILSGGYSLIPLLKLRLAQPGILVDIQAVGGLDGIVRTDDDWRIGGRATHRSILEHAGSVQHLDFLSPEEKAVYKTSFEIDQRWLLEFAADRSPFIDQAQSLNLFIPADVDKWDLMMLHFRAWELGIKSLYYLRSKSVQRAGFAGGVEADNTSDLKEIQLASTTDYDECLACQ